MHKIYLIVGRTASGKDSLAHALAEKHNLKILSSYTTRPKRPSETNEHIFIDSDQVESYRDDIVAYTKIGDYEYFATKQQLLESDLYIIDPEGIESLLNNIRGKIDVECCIIYIAVDYVTRKQRALNMRKDLEVNFENRCRAEEDQFVDFECNRGWHKRIENINWNQSLLELEKYIIDTTEE